jgi:hypothetical protein
MVEGARERAYWEGRAAQWNKHIVDPWHRIHLLEQGVIVDAIAEFLAVQRLANHSSWTEDSHQMPASGREV